VSDAVATAPQAVGPTQVISGDVRIKPGQAYRVDLVAPANRLMEGYDLVEVYLTERPVGEPVRQYVTGPQTGTEINVAAAGAEAAAEAAGVGPAGAVPVGFGPRVVNLMDAPVAGELAWGANFVPFGTTLAATPVQVPHPDGATASWILTFDELSATTITFESNNRAVATHQPRPPITRPGKVIPGRVIPGTQITATAVDRGPVLSRAARLGLSLTGGDIIPLAAAGAALLGALFGLARRRQRDAARG